MPTTVRSRLRWWPPGELGLLLGAHVSVAGGLPRACERATEAGYSACQIFVKSPNRWTAKPLTEAEVQRFQRARAAWGPGPVMAHAAYLVNLAAVDPAMLEKSRRGFADELSRCRRLRLDGLVVHPGAHRGRGEVEGLAAAARSLDVILESVPPGSTRVLLETTAGSGTALGWRLEQLEAIRDLCRFPEQLGICLDTCHLLAAGYPVDQAEGVEAVVREAARRFGVAALAVVHVNDSRHPRGSRRDRHANLGEGHLPLATLSVWLGRPELAAAAWILETPRGKDGAGHRRDLETLRSRQPRSPSGGRSPSTLPEDIGAPPMTPR